MMRFLIDANLPRRVSSWQDENYSFVADIDDEWNDSAIWDHAKAHDLTIVTKDADFSHRIILNSPPPRIIHFKVGNMRLRDFDLFVGSIWETVCTVSASHKLVNVFREHVESIE